jgi:hypothetical protein
MTGFSIISLVAREILTAFLFPLSLCLLVFVTRFLYLTRLIHGRGWQLIPGVATACALLWIFFGDTIRTGIMWALLKLREAGYTQLWASPTASYLYVFSVIISTLASLRMIYVFSKDEMGHWGWISAALFTIFFVVITHSLP